MARQPAPGTRERILAVASRLFYRHGVRAVGMNQIIAEAGTGKNLLYRHFATKSDLVAAYLGQAYEQRTTAAEQARAAAGDDPVEQLVATVGEVAAIVRRPAFRGCAFRNYLAEFPDDTDLDAPAELPSPAAVARAYLTETRAAVAALVAQTGATDPGRLTEQFWLLIDGLYLQATYRDRFDGQWSSGGETAVDLARRLVAAA